jgi:hypothetical protein
MIDGLSMILPVSIDDGADFSVMGANHISDFSHYVVESTPFCFCVADGQLYICQKHRDFGVTLTTISGMFFFAVTASSLPISLCLKSC